MAGYSNDLIARYKERLSQQLGADLQQPVSVESREYKQFKQEAYPVRLSLYERLAKRAGKLLKIKLDPVKAQPVQDALTIAHVSITPADAYACSIVYPVLFMLVGLLVSFFVFDSFFFVMFFIIAGIGVMVALQRFPEYVANSWRMKASNQMVLCVFYLVTYMRHTSNLELAITFASEHLAPPLSFDMKKIVWDVGTQKYDTVRQAMDTYLETWRKWNGEFIEAIHLIEGSLYETSEERRLQMLDKALDVILDETFEKMLHYAQNLKSPITMLHMLGIILPLLSLVILPLASSFLEGVEWYHLAILYNVLLPGIVFYAGKMILSSRPSGYGDVDITELAPELKKYENVMIKIGKSYVPIKPAAISITLCCLLLLVALVPVLLHLANPPDYELSVGPGLRMLEYRNSSSIPDKIVGPYGFGASVLSLAVPLALASGLGLYYRLRTKNIIEIRDKTKKLEKEFASALFQLSNRLGDGLPAELAFEKVADVMEDSLSGQFFRLVSTNIRKLGMGVKDAIFNPRTGAIVFFPSNVIQSSMKVLIESIRKGPKIAAQALGNVSRYIKEIHKVDERLKDLMAEIISDTKSQISFLTPLIAGIVVGIASMITAVMSSLRDKITNVPAEQLGNLGNIANFFGDGIPTYFLQIVIGVYVVQVVYILTMMANGVENGIDKLGEQNLLGKNLLRSVITYIVIAFIVMLLFNLLAVRILDVTLTATGATA